MPNFLGKCSPLGANAPITGQKLVSPVEGATVAPSHEGEDGMGARSMTVGRYEEIRRRLAEGRGVREIARALNCSRDTVREVRDGERQSPDAPRPQSDPLWMLQLEWPAIVHDLGLGHPLKLIWEEKAQHLTTYSNFWKQFYRKFPQYRQASITAREFDPGERVEVDYAGDGLEWIELKTGEIRKAYVFVAGLGFSQLLFAWAAEDMKSRNWLGAHRRMFIFYGGVPHVTVPDCLKQGVLKCHLYDPDLNPGYAQLASQFSTAVVPARPEHPKDKAIVEGLVKILMRYVRFRHRRTRFTSLTQINQALAECVDRINERRHTRFGISRRERFETSEKAALKPLPIGDFECADWKNATLHPDCYVYVEGDYYSAPHIHRHKKLRVRITENQVEIFLHLERLAIHPRSRHRNGKRIFIDAHFPPNSQAYYEATPQKLLSQSRFIHPDLNQLFVELFNADVYGHLRRCQGFVSSCTKEINTAGHELASVRISAAIATMRRYNRYRVPYFQSLLVQARKQPSVKSGDREIVRRPGNPMLRYVGGANQLADTSAAIASAPLQESLKL
jgi:transposase